MKIENQLCSYEQGKRLQSLGLHNTAYFLLNKKGEAFESWVVEGTEDDFTPGFSLAEVGVMLGIATNNCIQHKGNVFSAGIVGHPVFPTQAQAYTDLLIFKIETGVLTPLECNKRLLEE